MIKIETKPYLRKIDDSSFVFDSSISGGGKTPDPWRTDASVSDSRRALNMIVVIDVSGSMAGARIASVNNALENVFTQLKDNPGNNLDACIKVAVMEFAATAKWKMERPIPVEDYNFTEIATTPYITSYACAFDALNEKLSRSAFMDPDLTEYYAPLILFVTDGEPTDAEEYPAALGRLKRNGWFQAAAKYAITVGQQANTEDVVKTMVDFTGNRNNVRYADAGEGLRSLIQFILVRGSQVQTQMLSQGENGEGKEELFSDSDKWVWSDSNDSVPID